MSACPPDAGFFPLVYDELRRLAAAKLAGEPAGHSLDATALVHEAYLRLGGGAFADRSMFMRAAAVAMQRILIDHARRKRAGAGTLPRDCLPRMGLCGVWQRFATEWAIVSTDPTHLLRGCSGRSRIRS